MSEVRPLLPLAPQAIPWAGLMGVLMGTFLSTLNTRISVLGLEDIRGAVHAGFDEGAWITTAHTAGQMLVAPLAIWMGRAYGPRPILIRAALAFAVISFFKPFTSDLPGLLALQFAGGVASGFFVPLTLGFVLQNMPHRTWAYGIALYALNLEVSLNVASSLEGWYVDNWSWHWIFWQSVPLSLAMAWCLHSPGPNSVPLQKPPLDLYGLITGGLGLGLIYAGLDQGNRLDWLGSPLVLALLLSGAILFIAFLMHERTAPEGAVDFKVSLQWPLPLQIVLITFLRVALLATSFAIPDFLEVVRGYRALEVGDTLLWVAAPQLGLCLFAGYLLRRVDARWVAAAGFVLIGTACLMVAFELTPLWGSEQFLVSQLLQAIGQSFALSGVVFYGILHLKPQDALTVGGILQSARLMGGEIGQAFITTSVRVRGQIASNLIGQHVRVGDGAVVQRIQDYTVLTARAGAPGTATPRGTEILGNVVHQAAITQGIIDSLVILAACTAIGFALVFFARPAPAGPASP
jgi:MFS transporter, DHA2 family, multidrug resistance protein